MADRIDKLIENQEALKVESQRIQALEIIVLIAMVLLILSRSG